MADVGISVEIGGKTSAFESALNKTREAGRKWADGIADGNRRAFGTSHAAKFRSALGDLVPEADRATGGMVTAFARFGNALKGGAILGAVAALATAIKFVADQSEKMQEAVSTAMVKSVETVKNAQALLHRAFPSIFKGPDRRADIQAEAEGMAASGKSAGLLGRSWESKQAAEEARKEAAATYTMITRRADLQAQADAAVAAIKAREGYGKVVTDGNGKYIVDRQLNKEFSDFAPEGGMLTPAMFRLKQLREQLDGIPGAEDLQKRMKGATETAELMDFAASAFQAQIGPAGEASKKREAAAVEARAKLVESERKLMIETAPGDLARNRVRLGHLREDYISARGQYGIAAGGGDTQRAIELQTRMNNLLSDAAATLKDIRKNTESTKQ